MTGAESLFRTLLAGGIEVCFTTKPRAGTPLEAALARIPGIRFVTAFDERIATAAANGYARMAERPVATLLFSGPGLAEGAVNLRNAASAHLPIVNLIVDPGIVDPGIVDRGIADPSRSPPRRGADRGADRATLFAIEDAARPYSGWLRVSAGPKNLGRDAADALLAARTAPGRVASLVVPEAFLTAAGGRPAAVFNPPRAPMPEVANVSRVASLLLDHAPAALLLGTAASCGNALITAGRIAAATGATLLAPGEVRRIRRGAGLASVERIPTAPDAARRCLQRFRLLVLAGVPAPRLGPADDADPALLSPMGPPAGQPPAGQQPEPVAETVSLARPEEDVPGALEALVVALSAHATAPRIEAERRPQVAVGPITQAGIAAVIGALLPHQAVVADAATAPGREIFAECRGAPAHDWMMGPSPSGGFGLALAAGAAIACPDRPILCLVGEAEGAPAMQTLMMQALWAMTRAGRCVIVLVFAARTGAHPTAAVRPEAPMRQAPMDETPMDETPMDETPMETAELVAPAGFAEPPPSFPAPSFPAPSLSTIDGVAGDRIALAREMGVNGRRVDTLEELAEALRGGLASGGPSLIEVPV